MPSANEPRASACQRSGPFLGNSTGAGFRLSRYSQITLLSKMGFLSSSTSEGIFPQRVGAVDLDIGAWVGIDDHHLDLASQAFHSNRELDLSSIGRERVGQQFHHRKGAPECGIAQSCPCHRQRATEKIALAASAFVTCCRKGGPAHAKTKMMPLLKRPD
jgi:hypothetical protein